MTEKHTIVIDIEHAKIGCPYCDEWKPYFGTRGEDIQILCDLLLEEHLERLEKTKEPTDPEILEFLLNQFKSYSPKMNGESDWVFINTGFPMSRAKGKTARDAVIAAMRAK